MIRVASILMILCISMTSRAQTADYSDCKKELKKYMKDLSKVNYPSGKKVYYLNMTVNTIMSKSSRLPDTETNVQVYMTSSQMHYVSDVLTTYQDERDAFAIVPQRKMILWANGGKRPDGNERTQLLVQVQDTVLTFSRVVACKTIEEDGSELKVISLEPNKKSMEFFKISRIEYFIDPAEERIVRTSTFYLPSQEIAMRSIVYHELDLNYNKIKLSKPVYEQIFSSEDKLLAKYKGYQLLDKRN
jgi:hypothetical protein